MGRTARCAWIRILFAAACALAPALAHAAATAQGVALNAAAGCTTADLDMTLATAGATTESWAATTLAGAIGGGSKPTPLANFSGTATSTIPLSPQQPPNTLIGAYANVGDTPPSPASTAEFFVYYNCTTRQVLLACFGPYGTCPRTATQAATQLAVNVPTLSNAALTLTALLVAGTAAATLSRRRA